VSACRRGRIEEARRVAHSSPLFGVGQILKSRTPGDRKTGGRDVPPLGFSRPFSTAPPKIFLRLVTNNLDRAYRKSKMELCAQPLNCDPAERLLGSCAVSQLRLSPYPGRFCQQPLPFQYFAVDSCDLCDPTAIESVFSAHREKNCRSIPRPRTAVPHHSHPPLPDKMDSSVEPVCP
jgi:hypothetical protein